MDLSVSVRNLSKKYNDFLALDNINLDVEEGKIFALLGPNGAGKTTLMRILTTQIELNSGEAYVLGKNVVTQGAELRKLVSYVPQEMSVWTDISGYENLLIYSKIYGLPPSNRTKIIDDALESIGLMEFSDKLVSTYSGGMIRKLEIASAMMVNPRILFLDEPTIGLDPIARETVWEKLKALNKENGTNIFFTTHYMNEADQFADKIALINLGKVVTTGTPDELKHSIGHEILEIELLSPVANDKVEQIRKLGAVLGVELDNNILHISVKSNEPYLDPVMGFLASNNIKTKKISTSVPTLDAVFLQYAKASKANSARLQLSDLKATRERIKKG